MRREALARKIVEKATSRGYTVTKGALEILEQAEAPLEILEEAMRRLEKSGTTIIDESLLVELVGDVKVAEEPPATAEEVEMEEAEEEHEDIVIEVDERFLVEWRIQGTFEEFQRYFSSRYEKLSGLLRERLRGVISLRDAMRLRESQEANIIVMLIEKKESEKAWILRVDDPSGEHRIIAPKDGVSGDSPEQLLPDMVIGARVVKSGEALIARELILPDLAAERLEKTAHEAFICMISDIHVGSKHFREDLFENFLDWINREDDPEARNVKLLIIAGDVVDGAGVYPNQHKELEIFSVEEQFKKLAGLLSEIPERVKIIIGPGNHDPVQRALPQPPLPEKYRAILEKSGRSFIFVGNPAWIRISGRIFLIYHGQGLDDVIQQAPGFSHSSLERDLGEILKLVLRCRHLCPIYGETTPIIPTPEDMLVIDRIPHVFHTGHVHVAYAGSYRGVRIINSGTWQEQTSYQRSVGLEPTVGAMALISLGDLSIKLRKFV
ncbi:MAG: DNA-directed DNA polymerase II small subunit [Thaumarchaeota archaeon]|nr:DNA-directed DNA polymerase II small subunit [Candidatus Wolframiiraptor allenii]